MRTVRLLRAETSNLSGTFGLWILDGQIFCATLEPPARWNEVNRGCIPAGQYLCQRIVSPTFGATYEVRDVPGRTFIRLHPGNTVKDTAGCILLGQYIDKLRGNRAVRNSGETFKRFIEEMDGEMAFHLTITECY